MTRQTKGFMGIVALLSLLGFLVLPVLAEASEPEMDAAVSPASDDVQANGADSQSSFEEALVNSEVPGPLPDSSTTETNEDSSARPVPEIQLSMANPFGRTMTMGGRQ